MTLLSIPNRLGHRRAGKSALAALSLACASSAPFAATSSPLVIDPTTFQTRAEFCQSKFEARVALCPMVGGITIGWFPEAFSYPDPNCFAAEQARYENCLKKGQITIQPN